MKRILVFSAILMIAISFASCKQKGEITPTLTFNKQVATMGSVLKAEYSFAIPPNAKIPDYDGIVFVHFIDADSNIAFTDDHSSEKTITQWKAGQTIKYNRIIFVPSEILPGEYTVRLGIYDIKGAHDRVLLNGKEIRDRAYDVAKLTIRAPLWELVKYEQGWHDLERSPEDPFIQWRWTKKEALAHLLNPLKDTTLYFDLEGNPNYSQPAEIIIIVTLNDKEIDQIKITKIEKISKTYHLTKEQLGSDQYVKLQLIVDKTFIPAKIAKSSDVRELGVKIFKIILEDW